MTNLSLACLEDIGEPLAWFTDRCEDLTELVIQWAEDTHGADLKCLTIKPYETKYIYPACRPRVGWEFHDVPYDPVQNIVHDPWHPELRTLTDYLNQTFPRQKVILFIDDREGVIHPT